MREQQSQVMTTTLSTTPVSGQPDAIELVPIVSNAQQPGEDAIFAPAVADVKPKLSLTRASIIIAALTGITTTSSMTTGLLTVALPRMAEDLGLSEGLLLWPAAIYGLTSGCSLMIAGSIADVVGSRIVYLIGSFLLSACVIACGLSKSALQLIVFRGFQGIAVSMCLPTALSLLTTYLEIGRRRNIGFALVGAGQPLGYSFGLFIGGFFVDSIGWRWGWFLCAAIAFIVFVAGIFSLPKQTRNHLEDKSLKSRLIKEIDWIGAIVSSACLGMFSYVLASVSSETAHIHQATQIVLLCLATICVPVFIMHMDRQQKSGRPALIPNYLWKKMAFTSICLMVFITWAVVTTTEYYSSLFFQKVQMLSGIDSSLRFLPNIVSGVILSIVIGMVLHSISAYWVVLATCFLTACAPMLMAVTKPQWPYFYTAFWGNLFSGCAADCLFVVSALVITSSFPSNTQALASAVFNTMSQFGAAVGLAVMSVISSSVTQNASDKLHTSAVALLEGYQASFWACFGWMSVAVGIGAVGLRGVTKTGMKSD